MGGFVAPGDALRGDNGINHRLFRQQPQGVRQRNAIPQHGADNRFTFHYRSMKLGIDKAFLQQLLAQLGDEAMHAAYKVIAGKGATNYAIGLTGARLTEALMSPTRTVFPLSSVLDGWHGLHDVALSVPTLVSSKGVERVLDVPLDDSELAKLESSAGKLRETLSSLGF